jgi:hypothetical protein
MEQGKLTLWNIEQNKKPITSFFEVCNQSKIKETCQSKETLSNFKVGTITNCKLVSKGQKLFSYWK